MGIYTNIICVAPLKCCGKKVTDWQSKSLMVKINHVEIPVEHRLKEYSISLFSSGSISAWCSACSQMTRYNIEDGKAVEE